MATVPPGTTFEDRQPRWSWTGTWRGSGGSVFNIVQKGDQWVASGEVSGVARLYGNRAVGRATGGVVVPRTFDFVLSDDGMYAKGTVAMLGTTIPDVLTRISGPPDALVNDVSQIDSAPRNAATHGEVPPGSGHGYLGLGMQRRNQPYEGASGNALTVDDYFAIKRDNQVAAKARFIAMGMLNIRGRVHLVNAGHIELAGESGESWPRVECAFPLRPGQTRILLSGGNRYATPPEVMSIHKGDLVTVRGRYETHNMNDVSDCQIVSIVPVAQVPRAQASAPQMGAFPQVPAGSSLSPPPAGYYQCYRLNVLSSANACKLGDLQLDEQGNYSSTRGPGGTYVFDPAAGVVFIQ